MKLKFCHLAPTRFVLVYPWSKYVKEAEAKCLRKTMKQGLTWHATSNSSASWCANVKWRPTSWPPPVNPWFSLYCFIDFWLSQSYPKQFFIKFQGGYFWFFLFIYDIQHCLISAVAPQIPLCQRMLGSNPGQLWLQHWLSDALTTWLVLIDTRLDLIENSARSHWQLG
jgi:hypothetical protein